MVRSVIFLTCELRLVLLFNPFLNLVQCLTCFSHIILPDRGSVWCVSWGGAGNAIAIEELGVVNDNASVVYSLHLLADKSFGQARSKPVCQVVYVQLNVGRHAKVCGVVLNNMSLY